MSYQFFLFYCNRRSYISIPEGDALFIFMFKVPLLSVNHNLPSLTLYSLLSCSKTCIKEIFSGDFFSFYFVCFVCVIFFCCFVLLCFVLLVAATKVVSQAVKISIEVGGLKLLSLPFSIVENNIQYN